MPPYARCVPIPDRLPMTGARIAGTGHWVPEERPDEFVRAVLDFAPV